MNNTISLSFPIPLGRPLRLKKKFNFKIFYFFSIILIGALLFLYIYQINSTIQKTYLLQGYDKTMSKLQEENRNLEINVAKSNSIGNLELLVQSLNYEKVDKIKYIKVLDGSMVKK
jgi:hypothetical protein